MLNPFTLHFTSSCRQVCASLVHAVFDQRTRLSVREEVEILLAVLDDEVGIGGALLDQKRNQRRIRTLEIRDSPGLHLVDRMIFVRAARLDEGLELAGRQAAGLHRLVLQPHRLLGLHAVHQYVAGEKVQLVLFPHRLLRPVLTDLLQRADRRVEVLRAHRRVLLAATLVGRHLDQHEVRVGGDRHPGHLRVGQEQVQRLARLGVGLLLPKASRLAETGLRGHRDLIRARKADCLLERLVREIPALALDERLAGVHELPSRVGTICMQHLGVDLGTLLLHAHLDQVLRETRLRILRLVGIGILLGEAVKGVLRLRHVAERRVDRTELDEANFDVLALGERLHVILVALRRALAVHLEVLLGTVHAAPALAEHEQRGLLELDVALLVLQHRRRIVQRLVGLADEAGEVLDRADDLRRAAFLVTLHRRRDLDGIRRVRNHVRRRVRENGKAVLLIHLRQLELRLQLADLPRLDRQIAVDVGDFVLPVAEFPIAAGELGERGRVVGRVGVVLGDDRPVLDRVVIALGLLGLVGLRRRQRCRGGVLAVVGEELRVKPVGAGRVLVLRLLRRQADRRVAASRHHHPALRAGEALGEIAFDGVAVVAVLLLLRLVLLFNRQVKVAGGDVLDGHHRLLDLRILRQHRQIGVDRLAVLLGEELLVRVLELRGTHLPTLLVGNHSLDVRLVKLLSHGLDAVGHIARRRRPRARLVVEEDVQRHVEGTFRTIALAAVLRPRPEHPRLDLLVVALRRLLRFGLDFVPQHLRLQIEAFGERRLLQKAHLALGIVLDDLVVQLPQLRQILVDERLGPVDVALHLLDMSLHRDSPPEIERLLELPEKLVGDLARRFEVGIALGLVLRVLRLIRQTQIDLDRLAREIAPLVAAVRQLLQQGLVTLGRQRILPVARQELSVGIARLHVELAQIRRRLRIGREELAVDLHALFLLSAAVVVVGDLQARRPVLGRLAVGERGDLLLRLVELAKRQKPADFNGKEPDLGLGPLLLRLFDDWRGDVGIPVVHQGLDIVDLGLKFWIFLGRLGSSLSPLRGRSCFFGDDWRHRHGRQNQNGSNLKTHDVGDYTTFSSGSASGKRAFGQRGCNRRTHRMTWRRRAPHAATQSAERRRPAH